MEHWNQHLGQQGEKAAAQYLAKIGYHCYLNVRYRTKQVDLIACKKGEMRIIEVKAVSDPCGYDPEERLSSKKKEALQAILSSFNLILANNNDYLHVDLITVTVIKNRIANISHFLDILNP